MTPFFCKPVSGGMFLWLVQEADPASPTRFLTACGNVKKQANTVMDEIGICLVRNKTCTVSVYSKR